MIAGFAVVFATLIGYTRCDFTLAPNAKALASQPAQHNGDLLQRLLSRATAPLLAGLHATQPIRHGCM